MESVRSFSKDALRLDLAGEADRIGRWIEQNLVAMKKRGLVVAFSGGIDSSVVGALAVRALGPDKVFGLMMPEEDSSPETDQLGRAIIQHLGVEYSYENLTPILTGFGCYRRRDEAIRAVIPEYQADWKHKIVLPSVTESDMYRVYSIVAQAPDGRQIKARLPLASYLQIVAATNFKQRTRKTLEYFHADRLNYAVAGTPNLLEYDQGFFVKLGDGSADLKPIAHLYKTQVYAMAEYLGVPEDIRRRQPTTDTYSLPQSQEEFYFSLPYDQMDVCLYARNHGIPAAEVAGILGLSPEQVERVFRDIDGKRRFAAYLHMEPQRLPDAVSSVTG
jgi:NAD+ synthase